MSIMNIEPRADRPNVLNQGSPGTTRPISPRRPQHLLHSTNTVEISIEEHVGLICWVFGCTLERAVGHRML